MKEEKIIRKILDDMDLSEYIHGYDLAFTPDSTGMPAVYINLHITDDYHPSKEKISRFSKIRRAITDNLLDRGLDNYPYVRLVTDHGDVTPRPAQPGT
jgi:hypothetical protein